MAAFANGLLVEGNVGIGTTSPQTELDIWQGAAESNLSLRTFSATDADSSDLIFYKSASDVLGTLSNTADGEYLGLIGFGGVNTNGLNEAAGIYAIQNGAVGVGGTNVPGMLLFQTNDGSTGLADRLAITADGNVGIGTTTPTATLNVNGTASFDGVGDVEIAYNLVFSNDTASYIQSESPLYIEAGDSNSAEDLVLRSAGTGDVVIGNNTTYFQNDGMIYHYQGDSGYTTLHSDTKMLFEDDQGIAIEFRTPSDATPAIYFSDNTPQAGYIKYHHNAVSESLLQNTLEIKAFTDIWLNAGTNVGVGTSNPGSKLQVNGSFAYVEAAGSSVNYTCYNTTTDQLENCVSLAILKDNITDLGLGVETVMQLRPVKFNWKSSESADLGFIAEEVESVNPLLAQYDNGELTGVKYAQMSSLIIAAIQEQQLQIESTSEQINNLELSPIGDIIIEKLADNLYQLKNTSDDSIIDRVTTFSDIIVGNLKTGSITAKEITTEGALTTKDIIVETSATIAGALTVGSIEAGNITSDGFYAFQGTIDNLLVSAGLVSPTVQTGLISPLTDEVDVAVRVGSDTQDGKLSIQDNQGTEVASIDSSGNAKFDGSVSSDEVKTNDLIAGKIYADEIIARDGAFANIHTDNVSGITLKEIEALLADAEEEQAILADSGNWTVNTASESANLDELAVENLFVTNVSAINSLSVTSTITLGNEFVINTFIDEETDLAVNTIDTLTTPLKLQSLALAPIEMMAGAFIIDTNGNVQIDGNLFVAGTIDAEGLTLTQPIPGDGENESESLLTLKNKEGNEIASVNASGSAEFSSLGTGKLVIAEASSATASANFLGEIETNATAGHALLESDEYEVTIVNENVTNYTLVYVTPTTSTYNHVLYVKEKGDGYFRVGFNDAVPTDVEFNWWIIEAEKDEIAQN
ncbi:tail fiber domain-containing protein [Patescibacteria group bacterium]